MSVRARNTSGILERVAGYNDTDLVLSATSKNPIANKAVYAALQQKIEKTVNDLVNYYTTSDTYNKAEVRQLIGAINTLTIEVVATLPTSEISTTTIYFVGPAAGTNTYDEYVYVNGAWVKIGDTNIDLSQYVTSTALTTTLQGYYTKLAVDALLDSYYTKTEVDTLLNNVEAALDAKQNKTLDAPIVISDTTETTVEGALGGLNKEKQDNLDLTSETETGNPLLFTTDSEQVAQNVAITFEPIQAGSGDPSPSNPRAISGYDSVDITVPRKNWFDASTLRLGQINATTGADESSSATERTGWIVVPSNQTFYLSGVGGVIRYFRYDANKNFIDSATTGSGQISTTASTRYLRMHGTIGYLSESVQLELGDTATTYEPYNPITDISIKLNETLYSGTLDVESGKLVVDKAIITIGNLSWSYDSSASRFQSGKIANMKYMGTRRMPLVCDSYKTIDDGRAFADVPDYSIYNGGPAGNPLLHIHDSRYTTVSALTTAMGTSKVVFYLAAPITIQLSPAQVKLLQGANVVTTDGTSMSLTYRKGEVAKLSDLSGFADSTNADVVKASNRNLLDNPWFTVNQRGVTSGQTNSTYTLDRWTADYGSAKGTWSLGTNGVTLTPALNDYAAMLQSLENASDLIGKTLTLSVKLSNSTIYSYTFTRVDDTNQPHDFDNGNVRLTFNKRNQIGVFAMQGVACTVRAVKLELGSHSTLHLDAAPNYTEELLKCQRYFVRINNPTSGANIAVGFTSSTTNAYIPLRLSVPMRIVPSGSFAGAYALSTGASAGQSVSSIAVHTNSSNQELVLKVTSSGLTSNVPVLLYSNANASYIDLSAEL